MSEVVRAYIVNLAEIRRLIGSKDGQLANQIVLSQAHEIAELNDIFSDDIDDGMPTFEESVKRLIDGAPPIDDPSMCWYTIELVARHLGRQIPVQGLEDVDYTYLSDVDQVLVDLLSVPRELALTGILERGVSMDLPSAGGEPSVGALEADDCRTIAALVEGVDADDLDADSEILRGVRSYLDVVDEAVRAAADAMFFYG